MLSHAHALHGGAGLGKGVKRAARKADVVDVEFAAYSPHDPFGAITTLRKVLAGVQHTHLTMRLDHHKLCMHLLGLIEPFITLSPARNTLIQQPNETLDRVAFHIHSQRDLLSLALCSKRMYSIVFPRHFPYRSINCKLSNKAVWDHFVAHPSLALNVRRLEIMPECAMDKEIVPPELPQSIEPGQKSSEELVRAAIENMTNLVTLKWLPDDAPPFIVHFPTIWPALRACPSLKEVDVFSNSVFVDAQDGATAHSVDDQPAISSSDFASLGAVTMRSTSITAADFTPTLHCVTQLLVDHCTNLEVIKIGYGPELGQNVLDADIFFTRGRWPKLRTLHLLNIQGTPSTPDCAATFFDEHPTIEALHLQIGAGLITPHPGALPALRELRCSKDQAAAILSTPVHDARPLETLKGPFLTGRGADDALLRALERCKNTLRRVELRGISGVKVLRALAAVAPRLAWLDVAEGRPLDSVPTGTVSLPTAGQWADTLALFPGLTAFHGISFFSEVAFLGGGVPVLADKPVARKNDEVAALLGAKCPRLRRLDHWARGTHRVVVLAREEDKVRWVVMRTRGEEDSAPIALKGKTRGGRNKC